jgi:hypothetical protein
MAWRAKIAVDHTCGEPGCSRLRWGMSIAAEMMWAPIEVGIVYAAKRSARIGLRRCEPAGNRALPLVWRWSLSDPGCRDQTASSDRLGHCHGT